MMPFINDQGCFTKDTRRNGGKNLGEFDNVMSEYHCQAKCQETEDCEYFVYKKHILQCGLTNIGATPTPQSGSLFGPKYCWRFSRTIWSDIF